MGTGFDFTRLDDDFFLAAPDFSANAKLAASADLLPSGDYRFHILGSRFLGDPHTPPRLRAHTVSAARLRPRRRASRKRSHVPRQGVHRIRLELPL